VELISILFCLAGNPEYSKRAITTPYSRAMLAHFAPLLRHPAVAATVTLREKHAIAYDAPIRLAAQLDERYRPAGPLTPLPEGLDERWRGVDLAAYLALVQDFAAQARADDFFATQAPYFARIDRAFGDFLADKELLAWFDGVFGRKAKAVYVVAPALLTGPMSYGVHAYRPDGTEVIMQAMSLVAVDRDGVPRPGEITQWLLAHELAHPYVNPIIDRHWGALKDVIAPAFESVRPAMERQAYRRPEHVGYESLARAVQILYLADHAGAAAAQRSLDEQQRLSFLWTPELVAALRRARQQAGGRLSEDAIVAATRATFAAYDRTPRAR